MESEKYYFAGGFYFMQNGKDVYFGAVRPTGGLPYVTKNPNGLSLTSHHSSLYVLSDNLERATLVHLRSGGVRNSPSIIGIPEKLQREFKKVIAENNFYE